MNTVFFKIFHLGKQQEKILEAKTESLDSDRIQEAMASRAEWEAGQLADKIMGEAAKPALHAAARPGFAPTSSTENEPGKGQRR